MQKWKIFHHLLILNLYDFVSSAQKENILKNVGAQTTFAPLLTFIQTQNH